VCLFHDDDLLSPRHVECVLETIDRFPGVAAVATNAWIAEEGKPPHLSFTAIGRTHVVRDARQLATHYFSRYQLGIAPFPGYVYSKAHLGDMRFERTRGKYSDVSWLLRVADRGGVAWIVEPLMTYRLHATNDSRQESIGDRLKLLGYFKTRESTVGAGLIEDFRFFIYKKALELDRQHLQVLSPSRRKTMTAYLKRYRCRRVLRIDQHVALLQQTKVRLARRFGRPALHHSSKGQ